MCRIAFCCEIWAVGFPGLHRIGGASSECIASASKKLLADLANLAIKQKNNNDPTLEKTLYDNKLIITFDEMVKVLKLASDELQKYVVDLMAAEHAYPTVACNNPIPNGSTPVSIQVVEGPSQEQNGGFAATASRASGASGASRATRATRATRASPTTR